MTDNGEDGMDSHTVSELAAGLARLADKSESNSVGMTDEVGEQFTAGYVLGLRDAVNYLRAMGDVSRADW